MPAGIVVRRRTVLAPAASPYVPGSQTFSYTGAAQTFPIKPIRPLTKRPTQPAGRAPVSAASVG